VGEPFRWVLPPIASKIWRSVADGKTSLPGDPDIVHANCFQAPAVGRARLVFTLYDVSFWVCPEYTTEQNRIACQKGALEAIHRANGIVFISQSAKKEFERLFPHLLERRKICSTVVYFASRFPSGVARQTLPGGLWLAVGSLEPRKNYDALLTAFDVYWRRSKTRRQLIIAGGNGWNSDNLRDRIHRMTLEGKVRYEGYVSDTRLWNLYRDSFALVFPTHYEGFGLPVIESMSQGCPVITRDHSGLSEVGGSAAIYCENDPEQLAEEMMKLEADESYYIKVSSDSLRQSAKFSWENAALKSIDFYRTVLASSARDQ
jgi:glycosyltransferase involved in cell wall biosynthesis